MTLAGSAFDGLSASTFCGLHRKEELQGRNVEVDIRAVL